MADQGNHPDSKLVYKTLGGVQLSIHVFTPEGHDRNSCCPCIVFFFGGGWRAGSPQQFYPHCRYLASRGMVAMAAEYRVESTHGTTPFECVTDGKSAVRWIRQHARELGVDAERVAAGGGSAGGHVAAATGTVPGLDALDEDCSVSSKPDALILFNPVFDNSPDGFGYDRVKERWPEISPMHNIQPGVPATIVFLGSADSLVPVSSAEKYKELMEAAGSRCDVHIYDGQPHAFFNYRDGTNRYYGATVTEMDRFLASLGYLTGPPTLQQDS